MGDAANVIHGSGILRVAPKGSSLPDLTDLNAEGKLNWPGAFDEVGYTDDGVEFVYTPTFKDIKVDEEPSPIDQLLDGEKLEVKVKLAEATLENLNRAIAGSSLESDSEGDTLHVGSADPEDIQEVILGFEGPAPADNQTRVIIAYRAKVTSSVSFKYQRSDKVMYDVTFTCLADSSQPAGQRLFLKRDFNVTAS